MKTTTVHLCLETPTETDTQEHVYQKPVRDVNELKWHLIEMWSATSRASLIKRLINGKIVLVHASKTKKTNTLNICCDVFLRNFMTFKAYVTAVMNKLTYNVSQQPSEEVGNSVAIFFQIYFLICVPKLSKYRAVW